MFSVSLLGISLVDLDLSEGECPFLLYSQCVILTLGGAGALDLPLPSYPDSELMFFNDFGFLEFIENFGSLLNDSFCG